MNHPFTPAQVLEFLGNITLPATIQLHPWEIILDVPEYISTHLSRMHCGCPLLENISKQRMAQLSKIIFSHETDH